MAEERLADGQRVRIANGPREGREGHIRFSVRQGDEWGYRVIIDGDKDIWPQMMYRRSLIPLGTPDPIVIPLTQKQCDDMVDAWHSGNGDAESLAAFMGLTEEQYSAYATLKNVRFAPEPNPPESPDSSPEPPTFNRHDKVFYDWGHPQMDEWVGEVIGKASDGVRYTVRFEKWFIDAAPEKLLLAEAYEPEPTDPIDLITLQPLELGTDGQLHIIQAILDWQSREDGRTAVFDVQDDGRVVALVRDNDVDGEKLTTIEFRHRFDVEHAIDAIDRALSMACGLKTVFVPVLVVA